MMEVLGDLSVSSKALNERFDFIGIEPQTRAHKMAIIAGHGKDVKMSACCVMSFSNLEMC